MESCPVHICYMRPSAREIYAVSGGPAYATEYAAGLDLRACQDEDGLIVPAGGRVRVPTGIAVEPCMPGTAGFVYSRSGLGAAQGLTVAQGVGVIDSDYRGEIFIILLNTSGEERHICRGERVAQLIFQPVLRAGIKIVGALGETQRGAGGFGHTGRN